MDVFEAIKKEIMADPMNETFTDRGVEPLFQGSPEARMVIVGQAPGRLAEESALFWNDPSGDRLRDWLGLSREEFYSTDRIAHLPMDFYFPGKAKSGDLPPRPEFAAKWHSPLLQAMPLVQTVVLVGAHAQKFYLGKARKRNLTETVRAFAEYLPEYFPLVHPSPLNYGWMKKNPWFEAEVLPELRKLVDEVVE